MEQAMHAPITASTERSILLRPLSPVPGSPGFGTEHASALRHMLFGSPELAGMPLVYDRCAEIYGEGEVADCVYKVIAGAVRTYKILNDGRRQINAFHLPGDIFGLERGQEHTLSAEAIVTSNIVLVKRSLVLGAAKRDGDIARQMWSMTASELEVARKHALLLIKSAQERVVAFLLEMSRRMAGASSVELPMGRQDIADYLGLTIETVSRTFTQLESNQ
jgi:CRP/FNR family transcriptional regulator, nitrogen fixation regulation protein